MTSPCATLRSGHSIPLVGLGTYKITGDQVAPAVDAALTAGYRLFDTAKYYHNEPELGAALAEALPRHGLTRADVFLTTKFFPDKDDVAAKAKGHVEESLRNLKTEYLDLVLIHYPKSDDRANDDLQNAESRKEIYQELERLKADGLIRSIGVSNYEVRHIEEIKAFGKEMPEVNQVEFHPHFTRNDIREYCKKEGIFFQAFTSLGRQHPDLIGDSDVVAIAQDKGTTPQLVLLAWAVALGVGIVPKSSSPARIIENWKVLEVSLTAEEATRLVAKDRNKNYTRCDGWNVL